jgi:hypothetical protein
MGKGSTSYGTTTGTGSSAPWTPQQPLIQQGFTEAQNQLTGPPTVAPLSPQTEQGLSMTQQTAQSSQLPQQAAGALGNTLSGNYLDPAGWLGGVGKNDYIDQLSSSIGNQVVPQVMSNFALAGRAGDSPLAQAAVGQGIATGLAPYMFGSAENQMGRLFDSYQSERDRMMSAASLAPGVEQSRYGPANAMLGAGSIYDQHNQALADNPAQKLNQFMSIVGAPFGSQTSSFMEAPIAHTDTSGFRLFGK